MKTIITCLLGFAFLFVKAQSFQAFTGLNAHQSEIQNFGYQAGLKARLLNERYDIIVEGSFIDYNEFQNVNQMQFANINILGMLEHKFNLHRVYVLIGPSLQFGQSNSDIQFRSADIGYSFTAGYRWRNYSIELFNREGFAKYKSETETFYLERFGFQLGYWFGE